MVLGSEGRLGIICEATIQVRRLPPERTILGYLFPNWAESVAAMRDIAASEAAPSVTRVADANETAFSFATKKGGGVVDKLQSKALKAFLERRKGYDVADMCLGFIGYEGPESHVKEQRKAVGKIVSKHGGLRRLEPGQALRPEEVRHALHPRLPARPRRARRRVGDRRAVERARPVHAAAAPPRAARSPTSASAAT